MEPFLSIVVPTFNRPDALPRTLAALRDQSLPPNAGVELLVVEDANNVEPVELGEFPFAARLLRAPEPGASHARNVGWQAAGGRVVLFLGDDMIPARDLVERHFALHEQHPGEDVGVLGHIDWARELKRDAFMTWLDRGIQFDYASIRGEEAGSGHFYTGNVSLKRAALERVGGFDAQAFPFLYEDIDLGVRLFETGFRLIYARDAVVEHLHAPELEQWKQRMKIQAASERAWVARHPDQRPYFHDRFRDALARPPSRGRWRPLARFVPRSVPLLGPRVWHSTDLYFRQQLAPAFLDEWDRLERAGD